MRAILAEFTLVSAGFCAAVYGIMRIFLLFAVGRRGPRVSVNNKVCPRPGQSYIEAVQETAPHKARGMS